MVGGCLELPMSSALRVSDNQQSLVASGAHWPAPGVLYILRKSLRVVLVGQELAAPAFSRLWSLYILRKSFRVVIPALVGQAVSPAIPR